MKRAARARACLPFLVMYGAAFGSGFVWGWGAALVTALWVSGGIALALLLQWLLVTLRDRL